jgi:hypothetical protein
MVATGDVMGLYDDGVTTELLHHRRRHIAVTAVRVRYSHTVAGTAQSSFCWEQIR